MPNVTVEGEKTFEVEAGTKLVLCLEDNGIDVLHRCGGIARCTTCRVEVVNGEVSPLSEIERKVLTKDPDEDLSQQYRLACQIRVESDLTVRVAFRSHVEGMGPGPRPRP